MTIRPASGELGVGRTLQPRTWQLLEILADGEFHSGEALAQRLGVSRATVFNALADVAGYGVALQRIRGRGYRLAHPWQQLERDEIVRWLGRENLLMEPLANRLGEQTTPAKSLVMSGHPKDAGQFDIEILPQAASSNTLLLQRATLGAPGGSVLAVELQTAGRGRMGRTWHSGLGTALTFSLLWRFDCGLNALSGLSLAVGVAMVRALKTFGAQGVRLKWPNDILSGQGKLGGVLIEAQGDMLGPSAVVIGVGLNCDLPANLARQIGRPASALDEVCAVAPARNRLLAAILQELARVLRQFAQDGFAALRGEWEQYHAHQDSPVRLQLADGSTVNGIARGVSDSGELCLETAQGVRRFNSGEVGGRQR
ncbi:MAG: biotin--[acetyl-CoA-carboxylase] ligase [Gallionella sp.]|nr:MAG: biotin--[acetyl-CoA-carboxylase] ligase [Gallionella sp.]